MYTEPLQLMFFMSQDTVSLTFVGPTVILMVLHAGTSKTRFGDLEHGLIHFS